MPVILRKGNEILRKLCGEYWRYSPHGAKARDIFDIVRYIVLIF
jgi:hypothetical protein